jgi:superfamily I DNA and RNA helicase
VSKTAHPPQFIFLGKLRAPKAKTARCDDAPYAATIHKSQGSEYPAVVIPVMTQHYTMLQRNLLYTGVTRGKRLVVLVGQKKAVAIAVRNISGRRRWSKLAEWLRLGKPFSRQNGMVG